MAESKKRKKRAISLFLVYAAPLIKRKIELKGGLLASSNGVGEPVETFVETGTVNTAAALDVPVVLGDRLNLHLVGDLGNRVGVGQILFVGKDENNSVGHVGLGKERLELETGLFGAVSVVGVNNVDQTVRSLVVVTPQGTNLTTDSNQ